ncbi:MAG: hypothetical protein IT446_08965 [Phycisphaerales bacterium]|nr:hypothetical protein [Phycisphaerales bacterium]
MKHDITGFQADPTGKTIGRVWIAYMPEGLPVKITRRYKGKDDKYHTQESAMIIGATVVTMTCTVFKSEKGWFAASDTVELPQNIRDMICNDVEKLLL